MIESQRYHLLRKEYPKYFHLLTTEQKSGSLSGKLGWSKPIIDNFKTLSLKKYNQLSKLPLNFTFSFFLSQTEEQLQDLFPLVDIPVSLISIRIHSYIHSVKSIETKYKVGLLLNYALGVKAGYGIVTGLIHQQLLYPKEYRPFGVIALSPDLDRQSLIQEAKNMDVLKSDGAISMYDLQYMVESSRMYGLPKRMTSKEVLEDLHRWVGPDPPVRFPNSRTEFETELSVPKVSPYTVNGTFEEWLGNYQGWVKSGSSDIGRLKYSDPVSSDKLETYDIKPTKNMLPAIFTLAALISLLVVILPLLCLVIQKIEPSAIPRTAISSPFIEFAYQKYLTEESEWHGLNKSMILQENVFQKLLRYSDIMHSLLNGYAVSFDYRGFDTQPSTGDLSLLLNSLLSQSSGPQSMKDITMSFMNNHVLYYSDGKDTFRYKVDHGLLSGMYVTKYMSTAYNYSAASVIIRTAGLKPTGLWSSGDDNLVVFRDFDHARRYISNLLGERCEAKPDIFGISLGSGELLRTMFNAIGNYVCGYPNRLNFMQLKDWNPPPANDLSFHRRLSSLFVQLFNRTDVASTFIRDMYHYQKNEWAKKHHTKRNWYGIPQMFGGLGAMDGLWDGTYYVHRHNGKLASIKSESMPDVKYGNDRSMLAQEIMSESATYGLPMDHVSLESFIDSYLTPLISINHRTKYSRILAKTSLIPKSSMIKPMKARLLPIPSPLQSLLYPARIFPDVYTDPFPVFKHLAKPFSFYTKYLMAIKGSPIASRALTIKEFMSNLDPRFISSVNQLKRKGFDLPSIYDILIYGKLKLIRPVVSTTSLEYTKDYMNNFAFRFITTYPFRFKVPDFVFTMLTVWKQIIKYDKSYNNYHV